MSDRRSRGTIRSSSCFHTSSAFGFSFFMIRSRVGIRGVESSQAKEKTRLNTENTEAGARRSQRKEKLAAGGRRLAKLGRSMLRPYNEWAMNRENRAQKEKGQNRVKPQFYPAVIIPQLKHFASVIFRKFYAARGGPGPPWPPIPANPNGPPTPAPSAAN